MHGLESASKGLGIASKGLGSASKGLESASKGLESASKSLGSASKGLGIRVKVFFKKLNGGNAVNHRLSHRVRIDFRIFIRIVLE